jgi:hydrogenase nickel incorporation protein HypA/HybF
MHEMALCQGLMTLIDDQRRREPFTAVRRVQLAVGALGHVDPRALEFAFSVHAHDTVAEHATLEIIEVPGAAWCMNCDQRVELPARTEACPQCEGYQLIVQQGEELKLTELEVI